MRHIVVHLIRGEAGKAHESITRELTEKFDTFPIHDRIPPHITLKRWFELDQAGMEQLYKKLDEYVDANSQTDYSLKGFGNFGKDVIFVGVKPSDKMKKNIDELGEKLHEVPGMIFDEYDTNEELHATVAFGALKPFDYDQIWNHLMAGPQPNFNLKFDNIAVMKREKDKWEVDRIWEIK